MADDEVYEDRNTVVLAYLRVLHEYREEVLYHPEIDLEERYGDMMPEYGWKEADDTDEEWVVVWAELNEHGQMAWHVPREMVEGLDWLPKNHVEWDGHSTEEKLERLQDFIRNGFQ